MTLYLVTLVEIRDEEQFLRSWRVTEEAYRAIERGFDGPPASEIFAPVEVGNTWGQRLLADPDVVYLCEDEDDERD